MTIPTSVRARLRPVASRFTLSSAGRPRRAAAAFFGAPLDATPSFRSGTGTGPAAIRRLSYSLETYSPQLDRDLEDLVLVDLGDLDFEGAIGDEAADVIADAMA